jgi:AraC-like DNA-binding protein
MSRKEAVCRSERHSRLLESLDQLIQGSKPVYSSYLADELRVSARTLRWAVLDLTGMSLHRYVRIRRLSTCRIKLQNGATSVKSVALACGFWHLSDFAREYRLLFGELPSSTLRSATSEPPEQNSCSERHFTICARRQPRPADQSTSKPDMTRILCPLLFVGALWLSDTIFCNSRYSHQLSLHLNNLARNANYEVRRWTML